MRRGSWTGRWREGESDSRPGGYWVINLRYRPDGHQRADVFSAVPKALEGTAVVVVSPKG